jgi:acyl transferase domain-containing protein
VETVISNLEKEGVKAKNLNTSHAFHSPLMDPILDEFEKVASSVSVSPPTINMVLNRSGEMASNSTAVSPSYWRDHLRNAVQFKASVETLTKAGYKVFLEVGPNPVLLGMARRFVETGTWIPSLRNGQEDCLLINQAMGSLHCNGSGLNWDKVDPDFAYRRPMSLPTYPFQRAYYWADLPEGSAGQASSGTVPLNSGVITPILGVHLPSPMHEEVFITTFNTVNLGFLKDHVLHHVVVVPGAAYISMVLSAMVEMHGLSNGPIKLEDLVFPEAMVLPDHEVGRKVQLIFTSGDDEAEWSLHSMVPADKDDQDAEEQWTMHASGGSVASARNEAPGPYLPKGYLDEVKPRCPETLSKKIFYARMWEREYHLGPAFQWVGDVQYNGGSKEAWSQFRAPKNASETDQFELFPGLIDSCFQLVAATFLTMSEVLRTFRSRWRAFITIRLYCLGRFCLDTLRSALAQMMGSCSTLM